MGMLNLLSIFKAMIINLLGRIREENDEEKWK